MFLGSVVNQRVQPASNNVPAVGFSALTESLANRMYLLICFFQP
jgi:hypothetical protein